MKKEKDMKKEKEMEDFSKLLNTLRDGSLAVAFVAFGVGKNNIDLDKVKDIIKIKSDPDSKKEAAAVLEAFNEALKSMKAHDVEYSLNMLLEIEERIEATYPQGHKPMPLTLIPFGFYLGELIARTIPDAKWEPNATTIWDVAVSFKMANQKGTFMAKPFRRASKYWDDREDKMSALYRTCEFMSEIEFTKEYIAQRADKDGWIYMESGDKFRMMEKDKSEFTEEELKTWSNGSKKKK